MMQVRSRGVSGRAPAGGAGTARKAGEKKQLIRARSSPVPAGSVGVREIQDVQVLRSKPRGPDATLRMEEKEGFNRRRRGGQSTAIGLFKPPAHLDHHHVANGSRRVRGTRRWRLAKRRKLLPAAGAYVEDVHVVGGASQADACKQWLSLSIGSAAVSLWIVC